MVKPGRTKGVVVVPLKNIWRSFNAERKDIAPGLRVNVGGIE